MNKIVKLRMDQIVKQDVEALDARLRTLESVTEVWSVIPVSTPYGAAQRAYEVHVDDCDECANSPIIGCPEGERLATLSSDAHAVMVHNAQFN